MVEFIQTMWRIFSKNWPQYLEGISNTLLISLTGTVIGLTIGVLIGVIRTIPRTKKQTQNTTLSLLNWVLNAYIAVFRGTPMIVQSMVVYYGTSILWGWELGPMEAAFLVVSINTGAYMSEVVRGGILSIDEGQFEASRAIGMNHWQTMKEVVMPQAFRNILPSVGNEFVINIKDTSVLNVISVNELYFTTNDIANRNYLMFETFLVTAVIYFILTYTVTLILRGVEKRIDGKVSYELAGANQQQVAIVDRQKGVNVS